VPPQPFNVTSALLRVHPSHGTPIAPGAAWRRRQWGLAGGASFCDDLLSRRYDFATTLFGKT